MLSENFRTLCHGGMGAGEGAVYSRGSDARNFILRRTHSSQKGILHCHFSFANDTILETYNLKEDTVTVLIGWLPGGNRYGTGARRKEAAHVTVTREQREKLGT